MKKSKYFKFIFLISLFFSTSCTNMLDETPLSSLSPDNLFASVKDVETAMTGMYAGFTPYLSVITPVRGWGEMGTDIWGLTNVTQKFSMYTYTSADAEVLEAWSKLYSIINRANGIIFNVPKVAISETDQKRYMAEAYCIRAFCYMDLVQYFGGVPLRLKPTSSIEEALSLPRSTEKETWAQIISDLEYAEQYLPAKAPSVGRISKWTAKGLLAKAYLTRGGFPVGNYAEPEWFQKAAAKAYEVISASGIVLNPTTVGSAGAFKEYGKMFLESGKNSPESLWEIQFLDPDYGSGWGWRSINGGLRWDTNSYGNYYNLWGGAQLSSDFALSYSDDDIRFKWSVGPFTTNATGRIATAFTNWNPYKYRWERIPGNVWNSPVNHIVLRMADVYLTYAEASNEFTGDPNNSSLGMSAYAAINVVRKRAQVNQLDNDFLQKESPYATPELLYNISLKSFDKTNTNYDKRHVYFTGTLKERFRAAVLMERGWELMLERHRWFDLKRTGKLVEFCKNTHILEGGQLAAAALLDPIDKSNWLNAASMPKLGLKVWPSANIQPYQIYMPIPDTEININPAMKGFQNPGY